MDKDIEKCEECGKDALVFYQDVDLDFEISPKNWETMIPTVRLVGCIKCRHIKVSLC